MSTMFERDLGVQLRVGDTILRVGADPYTVNCGGNTCLAGLTAFSAYWAANYTSIDRGLAALLSGRQPQPNLSSGTAYIAGLCDNDRGYSINQPFTSGDYISLQTIFTGHEIGHNFG